MTKCGYVAILGAPNAGKSTLLNALVGSKIAIVTPKVQTTRNKILGISIAGDAQLVFLDTPGIYSPKASFEKAMVASAWSAAADADVVVLLVDAKRGASEEVKLILEGLKRYIASPDSTPSPRPAPKGRGGKPVWLALNKVDLAEKPKLLELSKALYDLYPFEKSFMISAKKGNGLELLKDKLAEAMQEGPWLFPEDQLTTVSQRDLSAETTREKIFLKLHQELPYGIHVETEKWEEDEKGFLRIHQLIYVQREAHKKILLGDKGQMLKSIGIAARQDLEKQLGRRLHLALFIKVRVGWKDERGIYEGLGLEYKK